MDKSEVQERLLDIAKADEYPGLAYLKHARAEIYTMYLEVLDEQIDILECKPHNLRAELKNDYLAHVEAGGDPNISDRITLKRTKKFQYDKKHALQFVIDNGMPGCIRIKRELDSREFKRLCLDGTIDYPDGEETNTPSVAISQNLGDLLILAKSRFSE